MDTPATDEEYRVDRYELLQMEMVATNLRSITVIVTDSKRVTTSQSVSPTYLLVVYEILFYQGCSIIMNAFPCKQ